VKVRTDEDSDKDFKVRVFGFFYGIIKKSKERVRNSADQRRDNWDHQFITSMSMSRQIGIFYFWIVNGGRDVICRIVEMECSLSKQQSTISSSIYPIENF